MLIECLIYTVSIFALLIVNGEDDIIMLNFTLYNDSVQWNDGISWKPLCG